VRSAPATGTSISRPASGRPQRVAGRAVNVSGCRVELIDDAQLSRVDGVELRGLTVMEASAGAAIVQFAASQESGWPCP
jgi:hypothetical protein